MNMDLSHWLVDIRPLATYIQAHAPASVHFDGIAALSQRQHELPEPSVAFTFVCLPEQLASLSIWQHDKGYTRQSVQLWQDAVMLPLQAQGLLVSGESRGFVWQPSLAVQRFVAQFSNEALATGQQQGLDIACGSGRDSVYLALQGWQMTAVDVRREMLAKLDEFAQYYQVNIKTQHCDCERALDPFTTFADAQFQLVSISRYLHRPLFPAIKRLIAPQGFVLYHTFMQGSEAFGSPKNPRFLLAQGELASIFNDFRVHVDEIVHLADGRPMAVFIAQRP